MPATVVANSMVEQTIDLTHQVKKNLESVDLVGDAKDLQKNEEKEDNEFLSSVRREVGQFYNRHVTSQMATTNMTVSIATWEEKADRHGEGEAGWDGGGWERGGGEGKDQIGHSEEQHYWHGDDCQQAPAGGHGQGPEGLDRGA